MLDLVLRLTRLQGFGEVSPEAVQAGVGHLEDPADVLGAVGVEERGRFGGVAVASVVAEPVSLE